METVKKHAGGAPKKAEKDRKSVPISVRFKPEEVAFLDKEAARLGQKRSKLIHDGALSLKILPPVTMDQYERAGDFARLGSNINQCAKRLAEIKHILAALQGEQSVGFDWHVDDIAVASIERFALKAEEQTKEVMPILEEIRALLLHQYRGE